MSITEPLIIRMANMSPEKLHLFLVNQRQQIHFSKIMDKTTAMWKDAEQKGNTDLINKLSDLRDACLRFMIDENKSEYAIA